MKLLIFYALNKAGLIKAFNESLTLKDIKSNPVMRYYIFKTNLVKELLRENN